MRALLCLMLLVLAPVAWAQEAAAPDAAVPEAAQAAPSEDVFPEEADWDSLASRVENAIEAGRASSSVLADLRAELVTWRNLFQERQGVNHGRISTVEAQIAALGPVPEDGTDEVPRLAQVRASLDAQLNRLRVPVVLADEAYAQADGLIGEIDTLVRSREAARFSERTQSPLNPVGWPRALTDLRSGLRAAFSDLQGNMTSLTRQMTLVDRAPILLALLAFGVVCFLRGGVWASRLVQRLQAARPAGVGLLAGVVSLGQMVLPFLGILALTLALEGSGMLGRRFSDLLAVLPGFALVPIVGHWLVARLLPDGVDKELHPLSMERESSHKLRGRFLLLSYVMFLFGMTAALIDVLALEPAQSGVVLFPVGVVLAVALFRVGTMLRLKSAGEAPETGGFRQSLRGLVSQAAKLAALAGVACAMLGYLNAFELITMPCALTLFVLATLTEIQRFSSAAFAVFFRRNAEARDGLVPVLVGFALVLLALPVLALIWGAQMTDLSELWARFVEGFSIGETVISPRSFLLFAVVFVLGYTATRLLQGALRSSVLPRTKLDLGAQNAVVSGVGYIGIFLAAVIAITTAGIDLSGLAIVAGALSVGIGFGLQNIVSNFVSGIILLIERPISQGDWIEVNGQMGYVRDISVRSTRIETFDRTDVIVPNADLVSGQVTNWTRGNSVGRVIVPVGVAYGTDVDLVTRILKSIAEDHPMVLLNPGPTVIFQGFGASSLDFEIRAILRDVNYVLSVRSEMNYEIARRFAQEGIEIPFPQQDLWLRNPEALPGAGQGPSTDPDPTLPSAK